MQVRTPGGGDAEGLPGSGDAAACVMMLAWHW